MNYMLLFLLACIILGLWSPTKAKRGWIVAVLVVLLVAFLFVSPSHM